MVRGVAGPAGWMLRLAKAPTWRLPGLLSLARCVRRYGEFGLSCAESVQRHLRRQVPKSRGSTRRPGMGPALLSLSVAMMMVCSGCGGWRGGGGGRRSPLRGAAVVVGVFWVGNDAGGAAARGRRYREESNTLAPALLFA